MGLAESYDALVVALDEARAAHEKALGTLREARAAAPSGAGLVALREATDAYNAAFRAMQTAELDEGEARAELTGDSVKLAEMRRVKAQREATFTAECERGGGGGTAR